MNAIKHATQTKIQATFLVLKIISQHTLNKFTNFIFQKQVKTV